MSFKNTSSIVLFFVILEIFYFKHTFLYITLLGTTLLILGLNKKHLVDSILPIIFNTALICFSLLIVSKLMIQVLFILNTLFIYWHLIAREDFYTKKTSETLLNLKNTTLYGNFLAFFFSSSVIYALYTHLSVSLIWVALMFSATIGMLLFNIINSYIEINTINKQYIRLNDYTSITELICINGLALFEICLVLTFLPFSYVTLGLLSSLCYYVLIGILEHFLKDNLNKRGVKLYLGVGVLGVILTVITTRWM